jgi:hypothetical protein
MLVKTVLAERAERNAPGRIQRFLKVFAGNSLHAVNITSHSSVLRLPLGIEFGRRNNELCWLAAHGTTLNIARVNYICRFIRWVSPLFYAGDAKYMTAASEETICDGLVKANGAEIVFFVDDLLLLSFRVVEPALSAALAEAGSVETTCLCLVVRSVGVAMKKLALCTGKAAPPRCVKLANASRL